MTSKLLKPLVLKVSTAMTFSFRRILQACRFIQSAGADPYWLEQGLSHLIFSPLIDGCTTIILYSHKRYNESHLSWNPLYTLADLKERSTAYASILLSLIKGENFSEGDSALTRERNRSYVLSVTGDQNSDSDLPIPHSWRICCCHSNPFRNPQVWSALWTKRYTVHLNRCKSADQNPNIKGILLVVDSRVARLPVPIF